MKVLVTGGLGFIGSHTVDLLIEKGFEVRILDNLDSDVHNGKTPDYTNAKAELLRGDVSDLKTWDKALSGIDAVIHLAAKVSIAQSITNPSQYLMANTIGTANMYESIIRNKFPIKKIVVASSTATYGEGAYECKKCGIIYPTPRTNEQLTKKDWEIRCPECGEIATPIPVSEDKKQQNLSTYALSKYDQERLALNYGRILDISTAVFRYFNVYGPRQSLNNPYSGVCAIFSSKITNGQAPVVFEDGLQTRDFIFVKDVARANVLALEKFDGVDFFNIGTGKPTTILDLAKVLLKLNKSSLTPVISEKSREGDIRHSVANVDKARRILNFSSTTELIEGLRTLKEWTDKQKM